MTSRGGTMTLVLQVIATVTTGLFAGAALYINLVEHPARMASGTAAALSEWRPSYKRATLMQVPLALVSAATGLLLWLVGEGQLWLLGAFLMAAIIPFTLFVIFPTNRFLLSKAAESDPGASDALRRWNRLHAVRTLLSCAAFVIFLFVHAR